MTKTIAIGVDVGGSHVGFAACQIQEKKYLPETLSENDLDNQGTVEEIIGACGTINSLSITLGTGFGSAFLSHRMPVTSGENVPETGAVWHLPFENENADDYFSTCGLLYRYQTLTGKQLSGVKELAQLVPNDEIANKLFIDSGYKMGIFLKPWLQKSKIEVLVIGGNISNTFGLFGKHLQDYLSENGVEIRIEISELKETAAMIGSSILADDTYYEQLKSLLATM